MNRGERKALTSRDEPGVEKALISLRGVSKDYRSRRGRVHAVSNVDLDVGAGKFVSLLGPSGCGKSTIMMMIAGLYPVSDGEIRIHDRVVQEPYTDAGIVFQSDVLMDWRDVLGNVLTQVEFRRLPTADYRERALELLVSAGLAGFEDKYPFELSGGMRQRVSICRALLHDPELLLMDEPFGALDALTREKMNLDLQRIWHDSGKTVLFITHSIGEAVFLSDRVVVMCPRPGRIERIIDVDLPRPRTIELQESAEFGRLTGEVHHLFKEMGVFD